MRVLIIGLGLMGGSMALALKRLNFKVFGCDIGDNATQALSLGIVDKITSSDNSAQFDIIILAMPSKATQEWLSRQTTLDSSTTVIDLCSTKQDVIASAKNIRQNFVAAHPMCGTEYSGPKAAFETLYNDKTVVLCDIEHSGDTHIKKAKSLFEALKMKIVYMDAALHDKHAAFISHLPHLLSFALANAVLSQESPEDILAMAAGGFKDMSRLAKSNPELWEQIFFANQNEVLKTIEIFEAELGVLRDAISSKNSEIILNEMRQANSLHQLFGNKV